MIELILSVCLADDPDRCKDVNLVYAEEMSAMQCIMGAAPEVARWIDEHPKWVAKRWSCAPVGQLAKI